MTNGESQFLSFHGIRVHFRVYAPQDAPRARALVISSPLINTFHWRKLVPELTQMGCLTVLIDLPGFGRSDCDLNTPQDNAMRANILWGVLDEIDAQTDAPASTWHLIAHGTACATLLEMASLYPDSVQSQVHICPLMRPPRLTRDASPARWYHETMASPDNFRRMIEHYAGYPMDDYILDRMRAPLTRPGAQHCFLRMLRSPCGAPQTDLAFCPAMAIIGGRDAMVSAGARAEVERCLSGAETHVLKSAGHFPMETHSKALRDYLRGWIRYNTQSTV